MYRYAIYQRDSNYQGQILLGTWDEQGNPIELTLPHMSHLYYVDELHNDELGTNYKTLTGKNLTRIDFQNSSLRFKWIEDHPATKIYDCLDPVTEFLHERFWEVNEDPEFQRFPLKIYMYDIETAIGNGFPDPELQAEPLLCITLGDLQTDNKWTWVNLDGYWKNNLTQQSWTNTDKQEYRVFNNEVDMAYDFCNWFKHNRPDILSGYNINGFDNPYLIGRLLKLLDQEVVFNAFSPVGIGRKKYNQEKKQTSWSFPGLAMLDYLELFRDKFKCNLDLNNYKLETVCQAELGVGKLQYEGTMKQFYTRDFKTFIEYNIIDVQRLLDLERKKKLIALTRMMCNNALCLYDRIFNVSPIVQGCLMLLAKREGNLLMTDDRIDPSQKTRQFEGAYVKCKELTKCDAFTTFDLNSLYPNIIISVNISPETKVGKIITQVGDDITVSINGKTKTTTLTRLREVMGDKLNIAANGTLFWKQHIKEGICSKYEKKFYYGRKQTKKEMLKLKAEAAELLHQIKLIDKDFDESSAEFAEPMKAEKEKWHALS